MKHTGEVAGGGSGAMDVPVTMDTVPVFLRGGHIVPRRERPRRSTAAAAADPYTLVWPPPTPTPMGPEPSKCVSTVTTYLPPALASVQT